MPSTRNSYEPVAVPSPTKLRSQLSPSTQPLIDVTNASTIGTSSVLEKVTTGDDIPVADTEKDITSTAQVTLKVWIFIRQDRIVSNCDV